MGCKFNIHTHTSFHCIPSTTSPSTYVLANDDIAHAICVSISLKPSCQLGCQSCCMVWNKLTVAWGVQNHLCLTVSGDLATFSAITCKNTCSWLCSHYDLSEPRAVSKDGVAHSQEILARSSHRPDRTRNRGSPDIESRSGVLCVIQSRRLTGAQSAKKFSRLSVSHQRHVQALPSSRPRPMSTTPYIHMRSS